MVNITSHSLDEKGIPDSFPVRGSDFCLCSVQNLLEFGDSMTHARMHVSLGTFDVVVQIVPEQLNVGNSGVGNFRIGKMTREEY